MVDDLIDIFRRVAEWLKDLIYSIIDKVYSIFNKGGTDGNKR